MDVLLYDSVCLLFVYLSLNLLSIRCVNLLPLHDDVRAAYAIYIKYHKFTEALLHAICLGDLELIREDFNAPGNP